VSRFESHLAKIFIKQLATTGFHGWSKQLLCGWKLRNRKNYQEIFWQLSMASTSRKIGCMWIRLSQQRQSAVSRAYKNKPLSASQSWRINWSAKNGYNAEQNSGKANRLFRVTHANYVIAAKFSG